MLDGEKEVFRKISTHCKVIFDVGARYDVDYIELSKGTGIEYHLFEINPKFFKRLKNEVRRFEGCEKIILNNFGVAEKDGEAYYYKDSQSILKHTTSVANSNERSKIKYPLRSLRSYCNDAKIKRIDFLKTDIEEYDFFALLGAGELLFDVKFVQFELGLGADYQNRKVNAGDYYDLLKEKFNLFLVKDENNPIWKSKATDAELISVGKDFFIDSSLAQGVYGIGYNVLGINNILDIRDLKFKTASFEKRRFEEIVEQWVSNGI